MLLHGFEEGRLGFRGGAVDFVRQDDGGEEGALLEAEAASLLRADEDVGAGDIRRHEVRGELDAGEGQVQHLRQHPHQVGLAQAGHAFQQHVAAGNHRQEQMLDDVLLADHFLRDFGADFFVLFRKMGDIVHGFAPLLRCFGGIPAAARPGRASLLRCFGGRRLHSFGMVIPQ